MSDSEGSRRLHVYPDEALHAEANRPESASDRQENAEIDREPAESERESMSRGETGSRLADWREAERAIDSSDPESEQGTELRERAEEARDAFHAAERSQRQRHGYRHREESREARD